MIYSFTTFSVVLKFWLKWVCIIENSQEKVLKEKLKVSEEELVKYLETWVLPNLVQFANLLHQRKPKFIKN